MPSHDNATAARLLSFVERLERLNEERKALDADAKEVKKEAKAYGFDLRTINAIIRLRAMEQSDREEYEALLDIYKASLGMLHDTPLGEAARRRLAPPKPPKEDEEEEEGGTPIPPQLFPNVTVDEARDMGRTAQQDGKAVTHNPFPARDPRRAAWDEAWCAAAGSDGMDIPEAWQRRKPPKDQKDQQDDSNKDNQDDQQ